MDMESRKRRNCQRRSNAFARRYIAQLPLVVLAVALIGCSTLLPKGEGLTDSPWQSYQEAQQTFDKIVANATTVADLTRLKLDPTSNSNITILNYSDILRRFVPSPSINTVDLEDGVQECIRAKSACKGHEVNIRVIKRSRYGNFLVDFLNFRRKVDIVGWSFNAVLFIKDDAVIYNLTGGQPAIHEHEETTNPLGPFQGAGQSNLFGR